MALITKLAERLIMRVGCSRQPDKIIPDKGSTYLRRWFLIPKNPFINVYLHQFLRSDDDRASHDHPWLFNASLLLQGQYVEHTIRAGGIEVQTRRQAGQFKLRFGPAPHRIRLLTTAELDPTKPEDRTEWFCWTLFITGPVVRDWGFHCSKGWRPSRGFSKRGCGQ